MVANSESQRSLTVPALGKARSGRESKAPILRGRNPREGQILYQQNSCRSSKLVSSVRSLEDLGVCRRRITCVVVDVDDDDDDVDS